MNRVMESTAAPEAPSDNQSPDDQVVRDFERDSDSLWKQDRGIAIATLVGPVVLTLTLIGVLAVLVGSDFARNLVLAAVGTFFVLGRFVILGGSDAHGLTPEVLVGMVFYLDVMTAIIISCHAGSLFRLPWLGERLRMLMSEGREMLAANRWIRQTTFLGVIAFVMVPLASSGSVGGSFFGRLLGLSRKATLLGVVLGSIFGCMLMYYGANLMNKYIGPDNTVVRWGGILFFIAIIAVLNQRYRRLKRDA
ncbi:MAG: small multi-drug export protein [Planctomycetaceae bacterium]